MVENNYIQSIEPFMEDESLAIIPDYNADDIIDAMWDASGKCGVRGLHSSQLPQRSAWNQEQSIQWKITAT